MSLVKRVPFLPQISPPTFPRPDKILEPLYVIIPIFNSQRYKTRWAYTMEFIKYAIDSGAHVVSIEAAFGDRISVFDGLDTHERHTNIVVTTFSELWIKENLLNLATQHLPEDWKYVAFVDPDIAFVRKDWVSETIQQLQHHKIVQMFNIAMDVDPNFKVYQFNRGFVYDYYDNTEFKMQFTKNITLTNVRQKVSGVQKRGKRPLPKVFNTAYCDECVDADGEIRINYWHGGFAWAFTRQAFSDLGGLFDLAILGAADSHMAASYIGRVEDTIHPKMSREYKDLLYIWQQRALDKIKKSIGYVDGSIYHYFHGAKKNRNYGGRWRILTENNYTPSKDVIRGWNGVYQLSDTNIPLRDEIQRYLHSRNEDSTHMEGVTGFLD